MLYKYNQNDKSLEAMQYFDFEKIGEKEKDLEELLAKNLSDLYVENGQLMTILQERQWQSEPDICALDSKGNLIIFELKRGEVQGDTTLQVMRYTQIYGKYSYEELNKKFLRENENVQELKIAHAEAFQLEEPLKEEQFNNKQKMVIVGCSSDVALMENVDYWKGQGLDIDFLPYRLYEINGNYYFEFFAKPYDYHMNSREMKGILFDTNRTYNSDAIWDMFKNSKVSAYGDASYFVERFNQGDYVFYYHKGWGVVGAGQIESKNVCCDNGYEKYRKVKLLTPSITCDSEICNISPSEIKRLLNRNFWWQSTVKTPYLSVAEAEILIEALQQKYKDKKSM